MTGTGSTAPTGDSGNAAPEIVRRLPAFVNHGLIDNTRPVAVIERERSVARKRTTPMKDPLLWPTQPTSLQESVKYLLADRRNIHSRKTRNQIRHLLPGVDCVPIEKLPRRPVVFRQGNEK
jgi:hypothetical protein